MNTLHRFACLPAAAFALWLLPTWSVGATTIDKTVNINVYQVCADAGATCASQGPAGNLYYAAETNKIWAQAGISVSFTFQQQLLNSSFYNLNDNVDGIRFDDLYNSVFGAGAASTVTDRVDMFLINDYDGAFGVGYSGFGGLVMSMKAIGEFDCGGAAGCTGRVDTLAHELGHNFGLVPESFADYAGEADPGHSTITNTLMASGEVRLIPTTAADIAPDGFGLDLLPQTHINFARNSTLLSAVPEPSAAAMAFLGLLALGVLRRRRPG
ncbi:PEP-CTERM sorting domain-containing protein [Aquabacterium sp.]|uniref:PEP-CTERM sorting domain-containing protein n=1 Tax=Aquabacterium TaxID=92793 RepID=UPI001DCA6FFE|nr:PEP-CTERM sorting domain-containing protein [Aquabacterium sp.]MBT9610442.1 PEP-CTERM sorting domain-containing protein [Aquabacterium sp.]